MIQEDEKHDSPVHYTDENRQNTKTFNMMVIDHFGYLVSEYNFQVDKDLQKDPDFTLEGFVEYQSPTTFVSVASEWYRIEVSFGRTIDVRNFALCVELVYESLSIAPRLPEIVCSPDPRYKHDAKLLIASQKLEYENAKSPTAPRRWGTS